MGGGPTGEHTVPPVGYWDAKMINTFCMFPCGKF